jgi:asparagine N-glycosylation enzyme membrane subunit Stt3
MSGSIEFMWQFAAQGYFVDPSPFILTARSLSALVGTSTVLAVYFAGRAAYDRSADLIAALLSAIAPLCVRARGTLHFRRHSPPRLSGDVTCFHVSPTENRDFI